MMVLVVGLVVSAFCFALYKATDSWIGIPGVAVAKAYRFVTKDSAHCITVTGGGQLIFIRQNESELWTEDDTVHVPVQRIDLVGGYYLITPAAPLPADDISVTCHLSNAFIKVDYTFDP